MSSLNELLTKIDLKSIKAENTTFEDLPDGYYLCEVEKVDFKQSQSSGNEMLAWTFKIVEDGITFTGDELDKKEYIKGTKNRKIFHYHVLKDERGVERMLSDLLKFEDANKQPLLNSDYFKDQETLSLSIQLLIGARIYIHLETTENQNGEAIQWKRFVSWKGAEKLELISD